MPSLHPQVEIVTSGRGGTIVYREGDHMVEFGWEFAMPPALALLFGPSALQWRHTMSWAIDRRAEIFDTVGKEVLRQQAPDGEFIVDLDTGIIQVNRRRYRAATEPVGTKVSSPNIETPAAVAIPVTREDVDAALHDHLSIEKRLAAAEIMHSQQRLNDIDLFLAGQIRKLHRIDDGLERALRLAAVSPTDAVKQALLWASCNATACAPHCASALLRLTCPEQDLSGEDLQQMLKKLDRHNSSFDRAAAFSQLCSLVSMTLDDG